MNVVNIIILEF